MRGTAGHVVLHRGCGRAAGWHTLRHPSRILRTERMAEVAEVLREAGEATRNGWCVAGFVAYEAAPAFDHAFVTHAPSGPLAWFGVYDPANVHRGMLAPHPPADLSGLDWRTDIPEEMFKERIAAIREKIAAGETYQVNATHRLRTAFRGDPWALFLDRLLVQPAPHAAFLDLGDLAVCSWSPELFFHQQETTVTCRPMKGTGVASADPAVLRGSEKDRAENIMIVDMVRNDLGHIARPGSVRADPLFTIETYQTVQQMTSTVAAETNEEWPRVFGALFPCASVTGAPKVQTMRIIRGIEDTPRKVYTGAIGCAFGPRDAEFNVAIRTAVVDDAAAEYGVGSGIVWDSTAAEEWNECARKTGMLVKNRPEFELLETLRWSPSSGFDLLEGHLDRLLRSAAFFNRPVDGRVAAGELARAADTWPRADMRVRLLADQGGNLRVEAVPLPPAKPRLTAARDDRPVSTADPFLYHKTTNRRVYDQARSRHPEADDVLLWNASGMACEFTIGNLVADLDGRLVTPPAHHGLLPGVRRARDLAAGRIIEADVPLAALAGARAVYLINSVRGWIPVDVAG